MSGTESQLQTKIIKYLKGKKCYVIKHSAIAGVPSGCPDVSFYTHGFFGFIEVKAAKSSRFQPLQKETIAQLDEMSWAKAVCPENWDEVRAELDYMLRD